MYQKTDDGLTMEVNVFDDGTIYFDIGAGEGVVGFTRQQALTLSKTLAHYAETGELPE